LDSTLRRPRPTWSVELHCQIIESPYHVLVSRATAYKLSDCISCSSLAPKCAPACSGRVQNCKIVLADSGLQLTVKYLTAVLQQHACRTLTHDNVI